MKLATRADFSPISIQKCRSTTMLRRLSNNHKYRIQPYHINGLNWRLVLDDPKRDNIIIVAGFMPSWWYKEYEITFGKEYHSNPEVRKITLVKCQRLLKERFGHLPNFFCGYDYQSSYPVERPYGDALIPGLFGCSIIYDTASGHPFAEQLHLADDRVFALEIPDIKNHPLIESIYPFPQEDVPKNTVIGELGLEGVLNIALKLCGEQIFIDMITNPDRAHHVFRVIAETMDQLGHLACERRDPESKKPTYLTTCNCTINMVSGDMYRKQLLAYDQHLYESFDIFGIHNCPWPIDQYLKSYAQMKSLAYLDMGMESDIDLVHRLFPDLTPSVFFYPPDEFRRLSIPQIKKETTELGKRIGRGYVLLQDIEVGTTDAQIEAAYEAASKL